MPESSERMHLTIPDSAWVDARGDGSHLFSGISINGTYHHLEALHVQRDASGIQHAFHEELDNILTALFTIGGNKEPFETVTIRGETYVLVVIPFQ